MWCCVLFNQRSYCGQARMNLANTVLNDILCYVSSARNTMTEEVICTNVSAFYNEELIKVAKELICKLSGERYIARKKTTNQPKPIIQDVRDMLHCFKVIEDKDLSCPNFVAKGIEAFPPSGFDILAPTLCALRDEIVALRTETSELRKNSEDDARSLNDMRLITQEVSDIKTMLVRIINSDVKVPGGDNLPSDNSISSATPFSDAVISGRQPPPNMPPSQASSSTSVEINMENAAPGWTTVHNRPFANSKNKRISNPNGGTILSSKATNGTHPRRNIIKGRRNSGSEISGGDRILDIYVGGCNNGCTVENVTSYCNKNGIVIKKCELLTSASEWTKSFKVSATQDDREKLLDGDFWPQGIYVRKFFKARERRSD